MSDRAPSPQVAEYLFVYGTLMGARRDGLLTKVEASFAGRGAIRAKLYHLGGYPGAKPDHEHDVKGELYRLAEPRKALLLLDEYEDCWCSLRPRAPHASAAAPRSRGLFLRKLATVQLDDGSEREAWVYFYNRPVDESRLIPSGDYRDVPVAART